MQNQDLIRVGNKNYKNKDHIWQKKIKNALFKFFMKNFNLIPQIQCFLSFGPCCFGNPNFIFFMFLSLVVERCERKLIKKTLRGAKMLELSHSSYQKDQSMSINWISMEVVFPYKHAKKNQSRSIKFLYSFNLFLIIKGCFDVRKKFIEVLNFL